MAREQETGVGGAGREDVEFEMYNYVRPSSCFRNVGSYATPHTPRVRSFPATPRTRPAERNPPVRGIVSDLKRGVENPYKGSFTSFDLRFTYLKEGGLMSNSPGPGMYETRHLTGGAIVKRPKSASPCFSGTEGRWEPKVTGIKHSNMRLKNAETRHTVHWTVQASPVRYSQGFRSKSDRLVVNKPRNSTPEYIGPGCYDLTKDGRSIGIKTERRVARRAITNKFLLDHNAYSELCRDNSHSAAAHHNKYPSRATKMAHVLHEAKGTGQGGRDRKVVMRDESGLGGYRGGRQQQGGGGYPTKSGETQQQRNELGYVKGGGPPAGKARLAMSIGVSATESKSHVGVSCSSITDGPPPSLQIPFL